MSETVPEPVTPEAQAAAEAAAGAVQEVQKDEAIAQAVTGAAVTAAEASAQAEQAQETAEQAGELAGAAGQVAVESGQVAEATAEATQATGEVVEEHDQRIGEHDSLLSGMHEKLDELLGLVRPKTEEPQVQEVVVTDAKPKPNTGQSEGSSESGGPSTSSRTGSEQARHRFGRRGG